MIKKLFLAVGLAALLISPAIADQKIQDNLVVTGKVTVGRHLHTSLGQLPTASGTGTPTMTTGSSDTAGQVTAGTSATSVVVTFATPYAAAPFCVVQTETGGITSFAYAVSTTAITVTQTATSGNKIDYVCVGVGS
ncbi:MAG: hypothetical protein KGL39_36555 [Patescibacteria group bacterium]|nr:hypothetical protein [Patescibacteria group bacterium]